MKCVVPGGNVKVLARAIHMLAKIGDEMYVNPQQESISFRTVNMAKSAYSDFTFHKNFFSYYSIGDLEEEEAQKCKISTRSAMTIFKSAHTLDKQVETCHIHLEVDACDLVFILKYKSGINKSYLSPILDSEKLQASYTKNGMTNELTSQARTLVDALQNFQQNLIEITLEITPQKLLLRNYIDDTSVMVNTTRTQLALGIGEFDRYMVGNETIITFCLKEFRAVLTFSESIGVPISAHFDTTGKPILFTMKNQGFEANLLLSTLSPDSDSQSDISAVSRKQMKSTRRKTSSKSISERKLSSRVKKFSTSTKSAFNNMCKDRQVEERNQADKTFIQAGQDASFILSAKSRNSVNSAQNEERNRNKPEQSRLFVISSPTNTTSSSSTRRKISDNHKKLVTSVFSSIVKRKLSDEDRTDDIVELADFDESVPRSPPHRVTKKAKLVFQKCFENTFDPQMLPGHDTILVEDSDENSSD